LELARVEAVEILTETLNNIQAYLTRQEYLAGGAQPSTVTN
jgi:hypothetical protein